jgi:lipoyl(octanoyl) transferase
MTPVEDSFDYLWLGTRPYSGMLAQQEDLVRLRSTGEMEDTLLLLEHPPTYTRGRRTGEQELGDPEAHRSRGIEVIDTPRGGGVTYHGPGQLVAYPVFDLGRLGHQPREATRFDVRAFVAALEEAMIETLGSYGVSACSLPGLTGIWAGEPELVRDGGGSGPSEAMIAEGRLKKIGSLGLRISRGVSSHGISLNVDLDLEPFGQVTACGIEGSEATSILAETCRTPTVAEAGTVFAFALGQVLGLRAREIEALPPDLAPTS